ncbi:MAG: capsular polysaccharide synthesis protein [Lachnospiraceae bacterium]|nr:capsular polysaccharide synthesis protein [Lachnospiraceae bacterium]
MSIRVKAGKIRRELASTARIAEVTGKADALRVLAGKADIQISVRRSNLETPAMKRRLLNKHAIMSAYFRKTFRAFRKDYKGPEALPPADPAMENAVYVCWWQGEEAAPPLVRRCVASIRRHAAGREVIFLTEDNYRDYVGFPAFIEEKIRKGQISRTHASDLLRIELLARYGGLWLDATTFCSGDYSYAFEGPVWSIKRPGYLHLSAACGRFANHAMAADGEGRYAFALIRDLLYHYWENNTMAVDYLFLDYLIVLAMQMDRRVREMFRRIPKNNPCCDDLLNCFGRPFDEGKWKEMTSETSLFKLTWKLRFPETRNGKPTFYGKLLKGAIL